MITDTHSTGFTSKLFSSLALAVLLFVAPTQVQAQDAQVVTPTRMDTLAALSDVEPGDMAQSREEYEVPNNQLPQRFRSDVSIEEDPVRQMAQGQRPSNPPADNYDGLGVTDNEDVVGFRVAPPDPEVDVGEEYILQEVNLLLAVYDKQTGEQVYGPVENNAIFSGFGGDCENDNTGDVITLYDEENQRWISSFMSFGGSNPGTECIAVSQTSDPTGSWYRYEFVISETANNDYPKLGVGPDAYYSSYNMFDGGFTGGKVAAHDRDAMIAGESDAELVMFGPDASWFTLMPADIDGSVPSPSPGGLFGQIGQDQFEIFQMDVDFESPDNSTFEQIATLSTDAFDSELCGAFRGRCVPQPNGPDLEDLAGRLMQRLQFRDLGDYQSMVVNHTVDADGEGTAGIRWYEFRDEAEDGDWSIYQQGTYAPDDGLNRWMGSIAKNADGSIGLVFTVSNDTDTDPSIRYTGRPEGAPLGQMTFQEESIFDASASQTGTSRWGDYSALDVDPSNGTTFWGTHEHGADIEGQFNWDTRIASFQFDADDETPPEAITDLSATPVSATEVDLSWTAPSDPPDGDPAAGYDIRFSTDPIETDEDFENAEQFGDPPTPSQPGETDEATVGDLEPDTEYFFAIKSSDFAGNTSDLSNVPSAITEAAPIVGTDPDSLSKTLNTGETGSDVLSILNEGDGTLSFALEPEVGGTEISDPLGDNAPTTSADEDYPMGKYETSAGAPPEDGEPTVEKPKQRVYQPDLGETVYYGVNAATESFVSFQGNNPEVLNQIASYPSGAGFPNAGDFPSDDNSFVWDLDADGNLRQIDVETGEVTEVGTVSGNWCGMATNPNDGTVYVNTCTELFILDPDGPSVESIGSLGIEFMIDIAIDGEGQMYGYGLSADVLYEIDKETAEITEVGSIGFDANFGQGLTWDTKNQELLMFAFNDAAFQAEFRSVDRATGSTELIGPLGTESPGEVSQLGWGATSIDAIPQWLTAEPTEGDVEAGGSQDIDLFYQTTFESEDEDDLIGGLDYFADVVIESNDPSNPTETVPVTLTVEGNPAIGFSDDPLDFGQVFSGTSVTESLSITNESDDAILQVADLQIESEAFTLQESSSFVLDPGESMSLPITFAPDDSDTFEGTLSLSSSAGDQEVGLVGQGVPFVSIAPDSLDQTIDLTTGDSTATQEFTVTNEFSEELPFDVLIETLEGSGNSVDLTPKLTDEQLRRYRQIQERAPRSSEVEPSLEAAPGTGEGTSAIEKVLSESQLDETGVTGYGNDFIGTESIVSFDIGVPGEFTALDDFVPSFAGNFAFANNDEIFWIDNETNELKTYVLEDGSVEVIGELAPEGGSDATWTDIETDPTEGTTYVTTGDGAAETNRLYELDVDDAELSLVGEFASGDIVVAFGIDDEGVGYAHEILNDEILTVDLETAEAEVLGSTGIDANFAQSMTWDGETGQMLMAALHDCGFFGCDAGTLRQVDRESGETTAIGSFPDGGGNELTWFATPGTGIPWLATNLEQGTLPAGATLTLEAQYDASEQVEGEYNAQISIVGTQLQGEPSESLPVSLSVEAAPILFLSKDGLEYDSTFVNDTTSTQMVTLRNDGLANMNVTDVSIDSDNFTVTPNPDSAFTIEPGDARIFEVAFTPTTTGELEGSLSFEGDEVSGEVSLTGEGIPAPELAVDPASFEKQAYLGQTQEETVVVTNDGGNPLDYDLSILPSQPPAEELFLEEDFTGDQFPPEGWFRAGANGGENWTTPGNSACSIWVPDNSACFYWSPSTDGTQRLVTKQLDTGGLSKLNVSFTHLVDHFGGDYELRLETTGDGGETWTTVKSWAPGDLPETDEMIELDNEDVGSDEFHIAWTFDGNSFNINTWGVLDVSVFAEGNWLAVEPESGTLDPDEETTLDLTVDTNVPGLEEGTFESGVNFATNDPTAQSFDLPFILNVIEEVAVTPFPTQEEVFPNQDFAVDFNVESLDDLEVFSYEMEMGFNADRMQVQEVVTDGTLSEDLTLTSDIDNDAGTVTIVAADASGGSEPSQPLFDIEGQGTLVSIDATGQPDHGEMTLDMQNMLFNEGEPPAAAKDSTMSVEELYGDVDLDLSISTTDASDALDFAAGKTDLSEAQKTHADVSGNGEVSAFDASLILQFTVGMIDCFPAEEGCDESKPALSGKSGNAEETPDISFSWGEVTRAEQSGTQASATDGTDSDDGAAVSVPLTVDQAVWDDSYGEVNAIQVSTKIDTDKFSVEAVTAHLPEEWRTAHHVSDDGTLRISMAGVSSLAKVGKIATLTLQRNDSDAQMEMAGTVAVNEASAMELASKSIASIPDEFALEGTYPNPFRQSATIKMDLPEKASVTVEVYDLLGRKVKTAHNGQMSAGAGQTVSISGSDLSSGTYFYRARVEMESTTRTRSGKMTVVQ
jgi:hypothetical protein